MIRLLTLSVLGVLMLVLVPSSSVLAAEDDCVVSYTRTACPGQEVMSFKKCKGDASCTKSNEADSKTACMKKASQSCRNSRLHVTKSKVITATWKGEALLDANGEADFCLAYEKRALEFDRCDAED